MHIYFVNYSRFEGSSGIHIHFLANELERLGVRCTACVPCNSRANSYCEGPLYSTITFGTLRRRAMFRPEDLLKRGVLIHAWTPRENVRKCITGISKRLSIPYFVHLEDNEEHIFEAHVGMPVDQYDRLSWLRKVRLSQALIHPARYREFIAKAAGVTCIVDALQEFVPDRVPSLTFWPACESAFFKLPYATDQEVRRSLTIPESSYVVTYTGNVHAANRNEVQTLYASIVELNRRGHDVRLLRCGTNHASIEDCVMRKAGPYVIELGNRPSGELIKYIAAANILVQPGKPDPFNNYRFPSKLPMYLASGRPTILPATNIGHHLSDGENCLLLHTGSTEELVQSIETLINNPSMQTAIGQTGRQYARKWLSWEKSAKKMLTFYERSIGTA
ncbi:glycosyltransferase family 1 protein [Oceanidesulfovibrio indonesiensis]|uniref:Glycosyltransferase family 1 protein n=2 Tax=Oceanidesulfovibrio indonesiensis TaxID=54767 RepID=A0A7M3MB45_9BACT|nr:glycosyltransferase family 1 protein [Oceanidesulfovibrio indonesiensis]